MKSAPKPPATSCSPVALGEIVVFNVEGRDIPIVHRVIKLHQRRPPADESLAPPADPPQHMLPHQDLLTKGDNNFGDDKVRLIRTLFFLASSKCF